MKYSTQIQLSFSLYVYVAIAPSRKPYNLDGMFERPYQLDPVTTNIRNHNILANHSDIS